MNDNIVSAEPQILSDLIQTQKESIVSKVLLKKKTGSLTLFAFHKGQELSEHTSPYEALIMILDGQAEVVIGGTVNKLLANEVIKLPANVAHAVKAIRSFKMLLIMIKD